MHFGHLLRIGLCSLLLLAGGCIHLNTTLTLAPDGSGQASIYSSIRQQTLDRLFLAQSLAEELQRGSGTPPALSASRPPWLALLGARDADQARAILQSCSTPTLSFPQCTLENKQDRHELFFTLQFQSLKDLAHCPLFAHLVWQVQQLKGGGVRCAFSLPPLSAGQGNEPIPPDLALLLADLNLVFVVETPSEILETNGLRSSAQAARWQFNYDRNPLELRRLGGASIDVTFASTGHAFPTIAPPPR